MPARTTRPKVYTCSYPECDKAYSRPVLLRQHENSHRNERPFKCTEPGCDKAFFKKSNLQDHIYSHRPMSERPFACKLCEMKFISLDRLKRHELTHTDRFKCLRDGCTRAFSSHQGLKHHISTFHDRVLNCDICNKFFQSPRLVKEHRIKKHSEVPSHPCTFNGCYSVFTNEDLLEHHVKNEHPILVCQFCGENCVGDKALAIHLSVHETDISSRERRCKLCGDSFPSDGILDEHFQSVHEKDLSFATGFLLGDYPPGLEAPSLETLTKRNNYSADIIFDQSDLPRKRGRSKVTKSLPLSESGSSVIDIVSRGSQKTYVCPYKSCQKRYVRAHFYEKHLINHQKSIDSAEARLESELGH